MLRRIFLNGLKSYHEALYTGSPLNFRGVESRELFKWKKKASKSSSIIQNKNGETFLVHPDQVVLGFQPDLGFPIDADIKEILWGE